MSMIAKEGDAIPQVTFKARVRDEKIGGDNPFDWKDVSTNDLFKGETMRMVVRVMGCDREDDNMIKNF